MGVCTDENSCKFTAILDVYVIKKNEYLFRNVKSNVSLMSIDIYTRYI